MPVRGSSSVSRGIGATLFNFRASLHPHPREGEFLFRSYWRSDEFSRVFAGLSAIRSRLHFRHVDGPSTHHRAFVTILSALTFAKSPRPFSLSLSLFPLLFIRRDHREYIWATYHGRSYYCSSEKVPRLSLSLKKFSFVEIVIADATWKGRCRVSDSLRDMMGVKGIRKWLYCWNIIMNNLSKR